MAKKITLPQNLQDTIALADWLELSGLVADDTNSSRGDLERQIKKSGTVEDESEDEAINRILDEVFIELDKRANAVGDGYPFEITNSLVTRRAVFRDTYLPYIFCLCLSNFGSPPMAAKVVNPRLLFEHISSLSLEGFLGGKALVLGTGRLLEDEKTTVKGFAGVIDQLAEFIGEGDGFKQQNTLSRKDDGIDVVGIKHLGGPRLSNLVVYGQCASGADWQTSGKLSQCQPEAFFDQWMLGHKISPPIRSYFIPYIVEDAKFVWAARKSGLLFERLRVSKWASAHANLGNWARQMTTWIDLVLTAHASKA
jgi:hypothetical protein